MERVLRQRAAPLKGACCAVTQQFDVARTELICPVVALRTLWHSSVDFFMGSKKRMEVLHSGVPEKRASWQTSKDTSIFSGLSCLEKCIGDLQVHRRLHLNDMF